VDKFGFFLVSYLFLLFKGPWNIAKLDDQDYSYHWVEFKDVDGDGLEDVFTARWDFLFGIIFNLLQIIIIHLILTLLCSL